MLAYLSDAHFSSNVSRTEFSDYSNPRAFLSDGSDGLGGISITNIGASGGETMRFTVNFPAAGPPTATAASNVNYGSFTANWLPALLASDYKISVYYKEGSDKRYVLQVFQPGKR